MQKCNQSWLKTDSLILMHIFLVKFERAFFLQRIPVEESKSHVKAFSRALSKKFLTVFQ